MAIDWQAYRAFLADVEAAEASGRKWHCEWRDHRGIWVNTFLSTAAPGGQYRVVYDEPEPPDAKPLEGWINVYPLYANGDQRISGVLYPTPGQAEEQAFKDVIRTVRVREVVEEAAADATPIEESDDPAGEMERARERHERFFSRFPVVPNVDEPPTPNPLAEAAMEMMAKHDAAHETVLEALERQQEYTTKAAPATDQLLAGVEAVAEVLADPQPLELRVAELERKLADHCHCGGTMNVTVSNDPTDPYADDTPNPLADWRDKYYEALAEADRLRSDNGKLAAEVARLTTQAQEWSLEAVIRRDKLDELQAYHDRREAEDRELDAAMDRVAANLPLKQGSGMLGKLRQAIGMESGSIRETVDAAVDRIARLTSRLAVFEGMVGAIKKASVGHWGRQHHVEFCESYSWPDYYAACARRCQELADQAGEVG